MNNFTSNQSSESNDSQPSIPKHLESLTTTVFQSLFPPISPQSTPLSSIKRVLLLNRETSKDDGPYTLNFRHYLITTNRTGLPKAIRRLQAAEKYVTSKKTGKNRGVPNLGKLEDVADYLLNPDAASTGFTSGSESEVETDAEVEVLAPSARKVLNKRDRQRASAAAAARSEGPDGDVGGGRGRSANGVEKRAVKLVELGPRMKLRLTKVEDGLCTGKVLWHEFVHKSKDEEKEMDKVWEQRRKEKEERRQVQKENIERKRNEKGQKGDEAEEDDEDMEDFDDDEWDGEDEDEDEDMEGGTEDEEDG